MSRGGLSVQPFALLGVIALLLGGVVLLFPPADANASTSDAERLDYLSTTASINSTSHSAEADNPDEGEEYPDTTPLQAQLRSRDKAQVTAALSGISKRDAPFLAPALPILPGTTPVLVLPARTEPYRLTPLASQFPQAVWKMPGGSIRLGLPLLVAPGASLTIDSAETPSILLDSGSLNYATIIAVEANLRFTGTAEQPLGVSSRDPASQALDATATDGRAYISASGSRMDFDHVTASGLGFLVGETSGVAWMAREGAPSTGGARDSTFSGNYFGAYSSGAAGLNFTRTRFTDNAVYGFDPHTDTTGTVIEDSMAARNGRHGLIFSRACSNNVIRRFESFDNGGSGIVIDDGNDDGDTATQGSDNNQVVAAHTHDNKAAGIVIEGGTGNSVGQSLAQANPVGIWVKNGATGTRVTATAVRGSDQTGIRLEGGTASTTATDVAIEQSTVGIADQGARATTLTDVRIVDAAAAGVTVSPDTRQLTLTDVSVAGEGKRAYALIGPPGTTDDTPPEGLRTDEWSAARTGLHPGLSPDFWVQLIPWLLVLAIPALLWLPIRWRWRRRLRAMHGEAGK